MKKGEATGPQKTNHREEAAQEQEHLAEDERETTTERSRLMRAWDSAVQRTHEEAQRLLHATETLQAAEALGPVPDTDALATALGELQRAEKKLVDVRLQVEQLESML